MALKKKQSKNYAVPSDTLCSILRNPKICEFLEVEFKEEAKTSNAIEFRYTRKTTLIKYGRDFYVKIESTDAQNSVVTVTTKYHRYRTLFDHFGKSEIKKVFFFIDMLLEAAEQTTNG